MVTTELTPCVDGYYAQICRTLVVGEANADQKAAHALWRESMEAGIAVVRDGVTAADIARAENDVFRAHGLGEYTTSEYTRVRGHGLGLFVDTKPHILEDVTTRIDAGMTLIVHPNTYHPVVGYMVLGDSVVVTEDGCEVRHGNAARSVQRAGLRSKRYAPRIDGLGCRASCRKARSTSASARLQAAMQRGGFDALRALHQSGAAERGLLAHRIHALLDRKPAAGRPRRARRCSRRRCRSGSPTGFARPASWARSSTRRSPARRSGSGSPPPGASASACSNWMRCRPVSTTTSWRLRRRANCIDATALFAAERRHLDAAERKLIERADAIAVAALDQVDAAQRAEMPARSPVWSRSTRAWMRRRKPISRSRPISTPTAA